LVARLPQTFVLEGHQPHRPLKVGIAADLVPRCAELDRRKLGAVLSAYTQRIMYRKAMLAGAARVDLDGNPVGEVSATDAEHAAAKLAETLASHEAGKPRPRRVLIRRKASFGFTKMKIARTAASANPLTTIVNVSMRLSPST
jgi:ProP effector